MLTSKIQRGFTLLELLISMSIFAIISLLTWQGFTTLVKHYTTLSLETNQLTKIALFTAQLKKDLHQMPHYAASNESESFFKGNSHQIQFTTLNSQGELTEVTYEFNKNFLQRKAENRFTHLSQISLLKPIINGYFTYIIAQQLRTDALNLPDGIQLTLYFPKKNNLSQIIPLKDPKNE